ncbi:HD domain-containing protein [Patescibacteria group bacterium]|nr:HD domain-containing protein [Patescibacteria group bacterium]
MQNTIQQIKNNLENDIKFSKHCDSWFYKEHVLVVERLALELCDFYPKANRDAVILSVWFHDIGRAHGYDKGHDVYGADYARKTLTENRFDKDFVDLIVEACKTHSCKENGKSNSLEGKILATADALSHYHNGFYLRVLYSWSKGNKGDYQKLKTELFKKMKRDLNEKIFFDEVREKIKPMYEAWQKVVEEVVCK